ncbi:MAG: hypothetical protein GYA36_21160 [Veillonellaceae bacterium]|nr:hypothetical protein [Veillonellaceae bacterium]
MSQTQHNTVAAVASRIRRFALTARDRREVARTLVAHHGGTLTGRLAELDAEVDRQNRIRPGYTPEVPVRFIDRVTETLIERTEQAITERGLDRPTGWDGGRIRDRVGGVWLYGAEYRYHYSNKFGDWWTGACYVAGVEDCQVWAVRVPRRMTTVAEALAYITPAAVRNAQDQGRTVLRQGDVWLIQQRTDNLGALPRSHQLENLPDGSRVLRHGQHGCISLPAGTCWKVVINHGVSGTSAD